jgi:hypothetical protein
MTIAVYLRTGTCGGVVENMDSTTSISLPSRHCCEAPHHPESEVQNRLVRAAAVQVSNAGFGTVARVNQVRVTNEVV